jgi:4-amino-4-deoxy-L-arabinose transferase-like glycosyltransferase
VGVRSRVVPSTPRDALSALHWDRSWSYSQLVVCAILTLVAVRIVCAASVPLAFDEALYWRYSKHLAAGFLDHPAMNPLMIRIGTSLFGDTPLGVRIMAILLGLPATWAVWRSAAILFDDERIGATAALFFNLTLVMTVGSMLATSDQIVVTTSCFLLYFLSKLNETGRGEWWLAIGAAFGLGMFSKYTTLFFAFSILAWLVLVPERHKWIFNLWTWAGAVVALTVFSPVLIWNAEHQWASLVYQSNRMVVHEWTLRFLGELIVSQFALATPPIFVLGCIGLFWSVRQASEPRPARVLIQAMVWPIVIYFAWHSLHERVQGNWPEPLYPAFVIAAAVAAHRLNSHGGTLAAVAKWSTLCAVPIGVALAAAIYAQAIFAPLPLGASDPTARILGVGWKDVGAKIEQVRAKVGALAILTTDYKSASWLTFYLSSSAPVVQINQRIRWSNEPAPEPQLFAGSMLYVCKNDCPGLDEIKKKFATVELLDSFARMRGVLPIESYAVYRVAAAREPVLDPLYADLHAGRFE